MVRNIQIFFICNFFFRSGCGHDNDVIILEDSKIKNDIFYVTENKPVDIVFENVNVKSVSCLCNYLSNKTAYIRSDEYNLKATTGPIAKYTVTVKYVFTVSNVAPPMFGIWNCTVFTTLNDNKLYYYFDVRNNLYHKVKIKVGYTALDFHGSNATSYKYNNGELIDWSCSSNGDKSTTLKLEYYNSTGHSIIKSETSRGHIVRFRQLMTPANNLSYVDCIYETSDKYYNFETLINRTKFVMEDEGSIDQYVKYVTLKINGIKIRILTEISKNTYLYKYKYLYGENLSIVFETDEESGNIRNVTMTKDISKNAKDIKSNSINYSFLIDTKYLDSVSHINYEHVFDKSFVLYLTQEYDIDPFVIGLRASNILYQYTETETKWKIFYQYSPNEPLNLTCGTNLQDRKISWRDASTNKEISTETSVLYVSGQSYSSIICVSKCRKHYTNTTTINLIQPYMEVSYDNPIITSVGIIIAGLLLLLIIAFTTYWYMKHCVKEGRFKIFHNDTTLNSRYQAESNEYTYIRNSSTEYGVSLANTLYYGGPSRSSGGHSANTENHYCEIDELVVNRNLMSRTEAYENIVIENDASINETFVNLQHKDSIQNNVDLESDVYNKNSSSEKLEKNTNYVNVRDENNYISKRSNDYAN